jgi:hypothetical protein
LCVSTNSADPLWRRLWNATSEPWKPLVFLLPGLAHWYYVSVQRLPPADLPLVYASALLFVGFPITVALRCHREGLAALAHRTPTILAGDIACAPTVGSGTRFRSQAEDDHDPGASDEVSRSPPALPRTR